MFFEKTIRCTSGQVSCKDKIDLSFEDHDAMRFISYYHDEDGVTRRTGNDINITLFGLDIENYNFLGRKFKLTLEPIDEDDENE